MARVPIVYFTDVLCVWAYIAQHRVDEATSRFGDAVAFDHRFVSVFGDTARKMETQWGARGGYDGFNAHLVESVAAFPEVRISPAIWKTVRPASSSGPHLVLKAVQLAERSGGVDPGTSERAIWSMRCAFFRDARDIAQWNVQRDVIGEAGADPDQVEALLQNGAAFAALSSDQQDATAMGVSGSPSFVLNDGRQKLYGNVGYRIIEANIQELLREPHPDQASWC